MASRSRVASCAVGIGLAVLGVGAALPDWTTWYFCPLGGVGHPGPLCWALAQLPANVRDAGTDPRLWACHLDNLVTGGLLLAVAAGVAWAVFRAGSRWGCSEAADYREAHGGAVCDGRADPDVAPDRRLPK